jgi:sugar phosphate isomerase/epimerase
MSMKLKLSCADFSFPLLSHDTALKVIALLGLRGVDIGLFANRSRLRPEVELRNPEKNGANLYRRLECMGLFAADIFLQLHENFTDFAVNHPDAARRRFARQQFSRTLFYAAAAGSKHVTILPGVVFNTESRGASLARATEELSWRVEHAATMDLTVAIEPHLGSITDTPERALELAALVPRLGFTLDYAHFTRAGIPDSRIEPLTARATHVHARCARKGRLQSNLTENTIDFGRALRALNRHRFNGWIALEYVWIDWEHCNEVDVLSETIRLGEHLIANTKKIGRQRLDRKP